jgi:NAD(P)H-hydrate epimerase
MQHVVTAEQMRSLDAATIEEIGLPGLVLMETAGRAVAEVVWAELCRASGLPGNGTVAVLCGTGNNGGDGHVVARCLRERAVPATVYLAGARERVRGDAAVQLAVYERCGGQVVPVGDAAALAAAAGAIRAAAVVVDALLGTGLDREVSGHLRGLIELINGCPGRIVSVDIPSGLSADRGVPLGVAVRPHCTVTMGFLKVGLAVAPGYAAAGAVTVAEIGIPRALAPARGVRLALLERGDVAGLLPVPHPLDHKTRRGHALLVAGSPGKRGAARLAALAALRTGAGLATIAAPGPEVEIAAPDPVMTAVYEPSEALASATVAQLTARKSALAIGPGMPTGPEGRALVEAVLAGELPAVLDADALNHLAGAPERVAAARCPCLLTPHPGEAARLLSCSAAEVERDRVAAARALAARSRAVVVLKGARTLVCDGTAEGAPVTINPTGGPALATAGSGDVLSGMLTALLGAGLAPVNAARLGVYLHGLAGELAQARLGRSGLIASDLVAAIPAAADDLLGDTRAAECRDGEADSAMCNPDRAARRARPVL